MATELTIARKLVKAAIAAGYYVSVNDGEEWTVKVSQDVSAIVKALGTTAEDFLMIRDVDKNKIGMVQLVWGNSPEELIADHSSNPIMDALVEKAEA